MVRTDTRGGEWEVDGARLESERNETTPPLFHCLPLAWQSALRSLAFGQQRSCIICYKANLTTRLPRFFLRTQYEDGERKMDGTQPASNRNETATPFVQLCILSS